MTIRMILAVTDRDWFEHLRRLGNPPEVNFWSPSPKAFKALSPGELFLFKLHAPINKIVGGGVFTMASVMPLTLAWEAFGQANGAKSFGEMRDRILKYRRPDPAQIGPIQIGCRILTDPFFLPEDQWFDPPASWSPNIVSFRTYSTREADGLALWGAIQAVREPGLGLADLVDRGERFGEPILIRPRLGQGTFRLLITDIYDRRCAISRERTLPALEAAHIKPYGEGGEHAARNGILMRRDLHSLFDAGYVTITPEHRFEVSRRIREEFENGRHYYELHGSQVAVPSRLDLHPDVAALQWHNEKRYLG